MVFLSILAVLTAICVLYLLYKTHQNKKAMVTKTELETWWKSNEAYTKLLINKMLTPEKIQQINDPNLYTSPDGKVQIRTEKCSQKDYLEFHVSKPIYAEGSKEGYGCGFPETCPYTTDPLILGIADSMLKITGCVHVSIKPYSLTFQKSGAVKWDDLIPLINNIIFGTVALKKLEEVPAQ